MYTAINGYTKQTMIDHINANFKGKSFFESPNDFLNQSCLYRGLDGAKCAVGLFIPDDIYDSKMEGRSFSDILNGKPELIKKMPLTEFGMHDLQGVHDDSKPENTLSDIMKWIDANVVD